MASQATQVTSVLVVDDNPHHQRKLGFLLEQEGYTVELAASGCEALEMVRQAAPDLILLDYGMPDMSGIDVLEQLSQRFATASVPVLFVSAAAKEKALLQPPSGHRQEDFLTKPLPVLQRLNQIQPLLPEWPAGPY